jgi:hypothetical protein
MEQGLIRSDVAPADLARAFLAYQNGLIHLWLTAPARFSLNASAEAFTEIMMAGIQSTV